MSQPQTGTRAETFRADVAEMGIKDPATGRERLLLRLGVALLVVGPVVALVSYFGSNGTDNPLAQRDYIIVALVGVAITVVGAVLFLRYSLAGFLRFWLARLIYEQRSQTDRLVAPDRGSD